jgi:hypothetical protein
VFGDVFEQLVHNSRAVGVFQNALSHNRKGTILGKPLESIAEDHSCRLPGKW